MKRQLMFTTGTFFKKLESKHQMSNEKKLNLEECYEDRPVAVHHVGSNVAPSCEERHLCLTAPSQAIRTCFLRRRAACSRSVGPNVAHRAEVNFNTSLEFVLKQQDSKKNVHRSQKVKAPVWRGESLSCSCWGNKHPPCWCVLEQGSEPLPKMAALNLWCGKNPIRTPPFITGQCTLTMCQERPVSWLWVHQQLISSDRSFSCRLSAPAEKLSAARSERGAPGSSAVAGCGETTGSHRTEPALSQQVGSSRKAAVLMVTSLFVCWDQGSSPFLPHMGCHACTSGRIKHISRSCKQTPRA